MYDNIINKLNQLNNRMTFKILIICAYILMGAYFFSYGDYLMLVISYLLASLAIRELLTKEFNNLNILFYN